MTSLILVPLLGFAGFAVDVGAWYEQASSLQRAADAAALAGVVWQPNFTTAEAAARAEATRNGFTNGVDGITVTVVDTGDNQLTVEIVDTDADLYFASLFVDQVTIGRQSVAEYVEAVPMGSPEELLRHGRAGVRLAGELQRRDQRLVHPTGAGRSPLGPLHEQLEHLRSYNDMLCPTSAAGPGPNVGAGGNTTFNVNPEYEGRYSYRYAIDIPTTLSSSVDVYLRDPNFNMSGSLDSGGTGSTISTEFQLRGPDGTPLNDDDNPAYTGCSSRAVTDGHHLYLGYVHRHDLAVQR
ncbi:MAG: pilus assembly protein TadG-related protein [Acidimicrobiales bacterium]